jgi:hypothetical protein
MESKFFAKNGCDLTIGKMQIRFCLYSFKNGKEAGYKGDKQFCAFFILA